MSVQGSASPSTPGVPTNSMALISLVAGVLGLSLFPFLGSIAAIITGNIGKKEIAASAGAQGGSGLAQAGVILGWIGVALGVLGACAFCLAFALPFVMIGAFGRLRPGRPARLLALDRRPRKENR